MTEQDYDKLLKDILQKYNQKKPDIPARILDKSINNISKVYADSYKQLFTELLEQVYEDFGVLADASYQSQLKLLQMIESRLKELDSNIMKQISLELEKSYASAGIFHTLATETVKTIEELKGYVPYSQLNTYKMEQIVSDTMEDLLFATKHTEKELKKFVRETFAKNLQYHAIKNENRFNIQKLIEKELSKKMLEESLKKKGFVGIVDSTGRKWNLKNYVDMAVSTKINQAYTEGLKDRAMETGKDLAVIPEKGATDTCRYFEGMIISLTGETENFPTYEQLKASGLVFHPRCRHSPFPIRKLELIPDEDIAYHNKKVKELKNIPKSKKTKK